MAKGPLSRGSTQVARKSARGKSPSHSLAVTDTSTASNTVPRHSVTGRPPTRPPSQLSSATSVRVPPEAAPSPGARGGEVSDSCYRNIVELFAKRYIITFDKDRLALEGAYASGSTFSCRYISGPRSPLPHFLVGCNTGTLQGHLSIIQTLSSFSHWIVFAPPAETASNATIDVLQLPDTSYFVTLNFNTIFEGTWLSVDMVFLLKENVRLTGRQDMLRVLWSPFVIKCFPGLVPVFSWFPLPIYTANPILNSLRVTVKSQAIYPGQSEKINPATITKDARSATRGRTGNELFDQWASSRTSSSIFFLLIIWKFDMARWGPFTAFEGSCIGQAGELGKQIYLEATFTEKVLIKIYPYQDPITVINLVGRSTSVAGASKAIARAKERGKDEGIQRANDLVAKFFWPEQTRVSEVDVIKYYATQIGETNSLVNDHTPTTIGQPEHLDMTRLIHQFLSLQAADGWGLRGTIFNHLVQIKYLDKEHMPIAFLDCSFCHWALWQRGARRRYIRLDNLMYDMKTKRGVLVDFDLARLPTQEGSSRAKDNAGNRPFMALDLLSEEAFKGRVKRLYRHDAESFAWCLVYICICMTKDEHGEIFTISPNPLSPWFGPAPDCRASKQNSLLKQATIHTSSTHLAAELRHLWLKRFWDQNLAMSPIVQDVDTSSGSPWAEFTCIPREIGVYEEPSDREWFRRVCRRMFYVLGTSSPAPIPRSDPILVELVNRVLDKYKFVKSHEPVE